MVLKSHFDDFSHKQLIVLNNALFYDVKRRVIFIICKLKALTLLQLSRLSQRCS